MQINPGRANATAFQEDGKTPKLFTVKAQGLTVKAVEIAWIVNWGTEDKPDWHTEFKCGRGVYRSWKQGQDGGTIEFH